MVKVENIAGQSYEMVLLPRGYLPVNLPAGEYARLCFLPDAGDGKTPVEHGMIT